MEKIGRNDRYPCGSGEKYKKCCINKNQALAHPFASYPTGELLKILALLMLQPRNHGKTIRLELAIMNAIKYSSPTSATLNLTKLKIDLAQYVTPVVDEDPPEEFFSELIYTASGNHIVFPGIAANGVEIVQQLLNTIRLQPKLPKPFTDRVIPVINLILSIHTHIAISLGYKERIFEDEHHEALFIPDDSTLLKHKELFGFSHKELAKLLDEHHVNSETFKELVLEQTKFKLDFEDIDDSPLLQKPFIDSANDYILCNPTAQLFCLNDFILSNAVLYSCLDLLLMSYSEVGISELLPTFLRMGWKPLQFHFPKDNTEIKSTICTELLFKLDTERLAYVMIVTEKDIWNNDVTKKVKDHSAELKVRAEKIGFDLKERFTNHQILFIYVIHKSRILSKVGLNLNLFENLDYCLFFSFEEIILLAKKWDFDNLTLWKYARLLHEFENNHKFAPYNTHLSKMKWYMDNDQSFYHSDRESPNVFMFEFEIESEQRRNALRMLDKRGIPFYQNSKTVFVPCYRKDDHFPIYISQDVNMGYLSSCLLEYECPIWCMSGRERDSKAEVYVNGILYWLHEMFPYTRDWLNELGAVPLAFRITLDQQLYGNQRTLSSDKVEVEFRYKVNAIQRLIDIYIPATITNYLYSEDNYGEQLLMEVIIGSLNDFKKELKVGDLLKEEHVEDILENVMYYPRKKFINVLSDYRDLTLRDIDLPSPRVIPKADLSHILQNQLHQLRQQFSIPETIDAAKDQNELLKNLVTFHIRKVQSFIEGFDGINLLLFLMRRQEAILQNNVYKNVTYPVKQACYGKYYNVFEEFVDLVKENNSTNLCLRILIEWVACWMPSGTKVPSDDEVDLLLAHVSEVVNYGALSDEITYGLRQVKMLFLPSGRLGIDMAHNQNSYDELHEKMFDEDFSDLSDRHYEYFEKKGAAIQQENYKNKLDKFENTFKAEWGIGIHDIFVLAHQIVQHIFNEGVSVIILSKEKLHSLLADSNFSAEEIDSWIRILSFIKRDDVFLTAQGFKPEERYPWRYNRRISYLMKPVITINYNNSESMILSARHLYKSCENLVSLFHNGSLPLDKESKSIRSALSEMNAIKGKDFRDHVQQWLTKETSLFVFTQEITIKKKGFFIADSDKGDIDILAIDYKHKIVYSIECKNTNQSKVAYDFHLEIMDYIGKAGKDGLIQKHIKRDFWLRSNTSQLYNKLNVSQDYKLISIVISKHLLPAVFLREVNLPIMSMHQLKKSGLPV